VAPAGRYGALSLGGEYARKRSVEAHTVLRVRGAGAALHPVPAVPSVPYGGGDVFGMIRVGSEEPLLTQCQRWRGGLCQCGQPVTCYIYNSRSTDFRVACDACVGAVSTMMSLNALVNDDDAG
jgi:hypothetical protein